MGWALFGSGNLTWEDLEHVYDTAAEDGSMPVRWVVNVAHVVPDGCTVLHCTVLHGTVLHGTVLHCLSHADSN
jgi:hypothetical protein